MHFKVHGRSTYMVVMTRSTQSLQAADTDTCNHVMISSLGIPVKESITGS